MKAILHLSFEPGDIPNASDLDQAFNLLREFAPAIEAKDHPVAKAYHKVVNNNDFTRSDWTVVYDYALLVERIAREKYSSEPFIAAQWAQAVLSACANMLGVIEGLRNTVKDSCREITK